MAERRGDGGAVLLHIVLDLVLLDLVLLVILLDLVLLVILSLVATRSTSRSTSSTA